MATTIWVNCVAGATLENISRTHRGQNDTQTLVLHGQLATRHGKPGPNSPPPVPGGPAGTVTLQLSESQLAQGAIHVHVVHCSYGHGIPQDTEVAIGKDLRLTGVDGMSASRGSDATNGTDGGNGGAAGQGSSGADGGAEGDIHIVVDENSIHLLIAVSWDLSGGTGGRAGRNGIPASSGGERGT
jgi:hypothetical protein